MQSKTKKRLAAAAAALIVLAILVSGTYAAFVKFDQATGHNEGKGTLAMANLVENFENSKNWKTSDPPVTKEIRVENIGGTSQFDDDEYVSIYTRISLKEYMDITAVSYDYFIENSQTKPSLFLIQRTDGLFVRFAATLDPSVPANLTTIKNDAQWANVVNGGSASDYVQALTAADFVLAQGINDTVEYYYVRTKAGDPNGQYGRKLPVAGGSAGATAVTVDGTTAVDHALINDKDYGHENGSDIECGFTAHTWKTGGVSDAFREYISWQLGADVILYSDWITGGGESVNKWILDDRTTTDAWAYWGAAVLPGASTKNLLKTMKLDKQPDGNFYYAVHADMEAVDFAGLDGWATDNATVVAALKAATSTGGTGDLALNLLSTSYRPATSNDRIFFNAQTQDPDTFEPWDEEDWEMTLDYEEAALFSAIGHIEIPLGNIIVSGQGVNLTDIQITNIQSPSGYAYTSSDIYISNGKIISKCLMSWVDFLNEDNFVDGTGWILEVPVVITLTDSVSGKTADFTVINMYK